MATSKTTQQNKEFLEPKLEHKVVLVDLNMIDDNPYQCRTSYPNKKIAEIADSIREVGLIEIPSAREVNGRYQLAFGHLRLRAFKKLASTVGKVQFGKMPIEIKEISDERMALISLEENLKRKDITPLDTARAIEKYMAANPEATEVYMAQKLSMTQGNISNMRRVLKLPTKVLQKIDEGRINFTMARELLVFSGLTCGKTRDWDKKQQKYVDIEKDDEFLMMLAIRQIRTENSADRSGSQPPTVDGIKKAIDSVANDSFPHLYPSMYSDRFAPHFDTTACTDCEKSIKTWQTLSSSRRHCTDPKCWEKKEKKHQEAQAAAAKKRMEEDIARRVAEAEKERQAKAPAPGIPAGAKGEASPISPEIPTEAELDPKEREFREKRLKQLEGSKNYPCKSCTDIGRCDGTGVHAEVDSGKLVCDSHTTKADLPNLEEKATVDIAPEILAQVKDKAGTRAIVLDLKELSTGSTYSGELKQGFVKLNETFDKPLEKVLDPSECTERCTSGFHYAFDSRHTADRYNKDENPKVYFVCANPKCLSQKKAAFTRAKNAEGSAKKKAEHKGIQQAIDATTCLDRPRMNLLVRVLGQDNAFGRKSLKDWLCQKFQLDPNKIGYQEMPVILNKKVNELSDIDLAKLLVEFCFSRLVYSDEDVGRYEIRTEETLKDMGITITVEKPGDDVEKAPKKVEKKVRNVERVSAGGA